MLRETELEPVLRETELPEREACPELYEPEGLELELLRDTEPVLRDIEPLRDMDEPEL